MQASVLAPTLLSTQVSCSGTHAARMSLVIRSSHPPRSKESHGTPYSSRGVPSEGACPSPVCSLADWRTLASAVRGHAQGLPTHGGTSTLRLASPDASNQATCMAPPLQAQAMLQMQAVPVVATAVMMQTVAVHPPACRLASSTRLLLSGKMEGAQRGPRILCALFAPARQQGTQYLTCHSEHLPDQALCHERTRRPGYWAVALSQHSAHR